MIFAQRSRSGVPLDEQSVVPTVPGVPWWGAVAIATGLSILGALFGTGVAEMGTSFKGLYVAGVIFAVLAVRRKALFTAVAQTPLVLFGIAFIALFISKPENSNDLKGVVFNVLLPIAKMFPLMGWTFVVVLAMAVARWFINRPIGRRQPADSRPAKRAKAGSASASTAKSAPKTTKSTKTTKAKAAAAASSKGAATAVLEPDTDAANAETTKVPAASPRPRRRDADRRRTDDPDAQRRYTHQRVSDESARPYRSRRRDDESVDPPARDRARTDDARRRRRDFADRLDEPRRDRRRSESDRARGASDRRAESPARDRLEPLRGQGDRRPIDERSRERRVSRPDRSDDRRPLRRERDDDRNSHYPRDRDPRDRLDRAPRRSESVDPRRPEPGEPRRPSRPASDDPQPRLRYRDRD